MTATISKIRPDSCVGKRLASFLILEIEKTIPKAKTGTVTYTVMGKKKCNTWNIRSVNAHPSQIGMIGDSGL
jgi:hypothetical protein